MAYFAAVAAFSINAATSRACEKKDCAAAKRRCVGQTEDGGMPSYLEVIEYLLVTINVDNPSLAPPQ
jgi:hypothetical protein